MYNRDIFGSSSEVIWAIFNNLRLFLENARKRSVVFLGATKANNSSNTKSHFQHTHAYTSSGHMTTLSRATGVPDVYRTLHVRVAFGNSMENLWKSSETSRDLRKIVQK